MPVFYDTPIASPLMLGTAQYPSPAIMAQAFAASRAGIATVSLRREGGAGQDFFRLIKGLNIPIKNEGNFKFKFFRKEQTPNKKTNMQVI